MPSPSPLKLFARWFKDAAKAGIPKPEAMALATADAKGRPSCRMVLMKGLDGRGLVFHTNYLSRKGRELEANPRAALLFFWDSLDRQVRLEGPVTRLTPSESDQYWSTRPRGSQISASISPQSQSISGRPLLVEAVRALSRASAGKPLPRPAHWGGYRLVPDWVEFWTGKPDRLHERTCFRLKKGRWSKSILAP